MTAGCRHAFARALGISVGVLAAVLNEVKYTSDQQTYREQLEALGFDIPITVGDRTSMFEGCWRQHCSAFTFVEDHRDRRRDYEVETLDRFDKLAAHFARQIDQEATA